MKTLAQELKSIRVRLQRRRIDRLDKRIEDPAQHQWKPQLLKMKVLLLGDLIEMLK